MAEDTGYTLLARERFTAGEFNYMVDIAEFTAEDGGLFRDITITRLFEGDNEAETGLCIDLPLDSLDGLIAALITVRDTVRVTA